MGDPKVRSGSAPKAPVSLSCITLPLSLIALELTEKCHLPLLPELHLLSEKDVIQVFAITDMTSDK